MTNHTDDERAEGAWFFAFSCPAWLKILQLLAARGGRTQGDLAASVGLLSPNTGVHLNKLERAGSITRQRAGANHICSLAKRAKVTKTAVEFAHPTGHRVVIHLG
jgi:DNA-binding Lrp family transcriptional regulator